MDSYDAPNTAPTFVPGAGPFSEPFLRDLDMLWWVDSNNYSLEARYQE